MTGVDQPDPDTEQVSDLEVRAIAAERLTFFVDAVIAIALTLLALDLTPPGGDTNAEVLRSFVDHYGEYEAFLISFLVIAAHWNSHHRVFRYVTHLDGRLTSLTLLWLLMQVVTPFATRVITAGGADQARYGFYATVQILADVLFLLMVWEIHRHGMHRDDTPRTMFTHTYVRVVSIAAGFAISIPLSFVTRYSYALWIVAPVLVGLVQRASRRASRSPA
jgi:uncharacterized membrane protein